MQKAIIGKKIGMTQIFDAEGKVVPVTVIEAGPCNVIQRKTVETDGYEAVQLGFGEVKEKHVNKALKGHFAKSGVAIKKVLSDICMNTVFALKNLRQRCDNEAVGADISGRIVAQGDHTEVSAVHKNYGCRTDRNCGVK